MEERRKDIRYRTLGRARIPEVFDGDMVLKDLSITGCRIQCTKPIEAIQLHTPYTIQIIPESEVKTDMFEVLAESRWIRSREDSYEAAFMILESPKGKQFECYVDYLVWRSGSISTTLP
ncbi:MAG: PilZ domain-containing protein [Treponema sp.]|nr:PilZ domain-containing protein [Treponema sp.]